MRLEDTPGPINWEAAAKLYEERLREAYAYIKELEAEINNLEYDLNVFDEEDTE